MSRAVAFSRNRASCFRAHQTSQVMHVVCCRMSYNGVSWDVYRSMHALNVYFSAAASLFASLEFDLLEEKLLATYLRGQKLKLC